jgi:CheY-like chemotaxis protein/glycine cleavage system H lipoate-binding protein
MSPQSSILVVDDEAVVCESCVRILGREGFNVEINTNPVEGLKQAQTSNYSAILLDLKMPQMDGLEFLGQLRKTNSDVPVIVITGYPSQDTANATGNLGVSDYVPKPFTPNEIADSVKRVVTSRATARAAAAPKPAPAGSWEPTGGHYRFFEEAWFLLGEDATVRTGAVLPRLASAPASVVLPAVGETVYRGLPLAALRFADGSERRIPSPVTGKVLEVNSGFAGTLGAAGRSPQAEGAWIARIAPVDLNEDLLFSRTRNVVLATSDGAKADRQVEALTALGCKVHLAEPASMLATVAAHESAILLVDAGSFGRTGPDAVRQVSSAFPKVRIVVLADGDTGLEAAYRTARIFFYALRPFEDGEILDVLHEAYRGAERPAFAEEMESKFLPKWVSRVHITNRKGSRVTLLSFGELLLYHQGVGRQLIGKILDQAYPIETTRGKEASTPADSFGQTRIRSELCGCNRLVLVYGEDTGKIPGRITAKAAKEVLAGFGPEELKKVSLFAVETRSPAASLTFDVRTTEALAEHLFREMVSR